MAPYPLQRFAREVGAMPVEQEQQFLAFLPLAARLAALGERSQLDRWPALAKPFQNRLADLLVERSREGVWDLQQALDEDLGLAVISCRTSLASSGFAAIFFLKPHGVALRHGLRKPRTRL